MNVLLLHDAGENDLPYDVYGPLQEAGHRVASHDADADVLPEFLAAMRWEPDAFVADLRGDAGRVLAALTTLGSLPGAQGKPVLLTRVPRAMRDETERLNPDALLVDDPVAALEEVS